MNGGLARYAVGVAAAVALAVYLPSLAGGFLYDDLRVIVGNRGIRDLGALRAVLLAEPSRPLLGLSWALNYAASGLTPWPYHLVNVLVHAGNAALVASLVLWMARRSGRSESPEAVALVAGTLFAATPMAAETVGYVASRSSALAALFGLAALRVAVATLEAPSVRRTAAALGLFLLALATKEEAAALPLLLLLLDASFVAGSDARRLAGRWRLHLPFVVLPVLGLAARAFVTGSWLPPAALGHGRYAATQLALFPAYALRSLVPLDPAFYRGQAAVTWPPQAWALAGWTATAAIVVAAVRGRRLWPEWSFAAGWLAAALLPSSSILPLKEMVADHRAYLGGAGCAYALGAALVRHRRLRLAAALVVLWAAVALRYQWVLADPVRAWQDAVRRAPVSAEANLALGDAYAARNDVRAESAYRNATLLEPGGARGWTNLGAYYAAAGRLTEAEAAMRAAVEAAPRDARIRDNHGMLLVALRRDAEAAGAFAAAVAADPLLAQPRINLAALLLRRGDRDRARALLEEASRLVLDPDDDEALVALQQELGPP